MKQCPRCKEIIGDALTKCPNCYTEFTEKQLEEMKRAMQEKEVQDLIRERERINRFMTKRYIMGAMILTAWAILLVSLLFIGHKVLMTIVLIVFGVLFVGGLIFGFVSGAVFCPHCGEILFRNYGNYCMRCGKKIF